MTIVPYNEYDRTPSSQSKEMKFNVNEIFNHTIAICTKKSHHIFEKPSTVSFAFDITRKKLAIFIGSKIEESSCTMSAYLIDEIIFVLHPISAITKNAKKYKVKPLCYEYDLEDLPTTAPAPTPTVTPLPRAPTATPPPLAPTATPLPRAPTATPLPRAPTATPPPLAPTTTTRAPASAPAPPFSQLFASLIPRSSAQLIPQPSAPTTTRPSAPPIPRPSDISLSQDTPFPTPFATTIEPNISLMSDSRFIKITPNKMYDLSSTDLILPIGKRININHTIGIFEIGNNYIFHTTSIIKFDFANKITITNNDNPFDFHINKIIFVIAPKTGDVKFGTVKAGATENPYHR
jgi:hypothetical protein